MLEDDTWAELIEGEAATRALEVVERIRKLSSQVPDHPALLGAPGSVITRAVAALPDSPVDLRVSLVAGLYAAQSTLSHVAELVTAGRRVPSPVLRGLLRTALLGAGRVVFALYPEDGEARTANMRLVLQQESASLMRSYDAASAFSSLQGLAPAAETVATQKARHALVLPVGGPPGEEETLRAMAEVIGEALAVRGFVRGRESEVFPEHVAWIFDTYSGVAHGFGWPLLVSGGDIGMDFLMVACVAELAFVVTVQCSEGRPRQSDA